MRWMFILCCIVLGSCQSIQNNSSITPVSSSHVRDGAPSGPIPTHFKFFRPKAEPLSRYGNPDTYQVGGHTYKVLTSASGYHAKGLASWYGTKFHAKRTSSGEFYDMYALTAAHKTLPLPSYIRVKNLANGRIAIVKVNDRGPFHSQRILDLSYGAAVKLGLFPKGTAMVEVEALQLVQKGKASVARYYLQVGAFESQKLANDFKQKLLKWSREKVFIERYQKRYLVKIGPMNTQTQTNQLKKMLQRHGISGAFVALG